MFKFTYNEYLIEKNHNRLIFFQVEKIQSNTVDIVLFIDEKDGTIPKKINKTIPLFQDCKESVEYVEVCSRRIYANQYYYPYITLAAYLTC